MRSAAVGHEIRKVAEEKKLDMVCLQEPYTRNGKMQNMPITAQIQSMGQNPMAVTVLFNKNYRLFLLTQFSDDHCVCVELQTSIGKFIIVNIYHQFNEDIEAYVTKMRRIFLAYRNDPVIIAMDANAKSVLWHSGITDAKGEK
ncbi:hypothetical protein JTB14_016136 [Gonioctena quinquepunctata]|nr:hypothetical protein JTB14_016136 [Gonioctena quinquepunctata]